MALTAAIATAVAAVGAAATVGLPPALVAVALVPGLTLVRARPTRRPPAWLSTRLLMWITAAGALVAYLTRVGDSAGGLLLLGRIGILAVVPLSLFWPEPPVVRYCVVLSAGALALGATVSVLAVGWPLIAFAAGAAVALVAANRLSAATVPPLVPGAQSAAAVGRRRLAGEAAIILVVAGLVGLLVATLLAPPSGRGGGMSRAGSRPSRSSAEAPPYLFPTDELDAGGRGSGKGDQVLFRVSAPGPALWRTQTFGTWDGRRWEVSAGPALGSTANQMGRHAFVPPGLGDAFFEGAPFVQRVTVQAAAIALLPATPRPSSVDLPRGRVAVYDDGTVAVPGLVGKGTTYVVTSFLPSSDEARARAPDGSAAEQAGEVARRYLGFPTLPERVSLLAGEITATAPTPYDKATALVSWLRANTEVTAGTPPLSPGGDPIDQFLLNGRGSNEQAATTMAVMLRSIGVPSRVAVGYLPGQRAWLGGEFVVRVRHAHAWVEAWFPGAGWVAFDPTGRVAPGPPEPDNFLSRLRHLLGALWWVLLVTLAAALLWAAWKAFGWWRRRRARPWVTRCYERLTRAGKRRGRARQPAETPAEYCDALAADIPDDRLTRVGELLSTAAYSTRELPAEARAWADDVVRDLERRGGRGGRIRPSAKAPPG